MNLIYGLNGTHLLLLTVIVALWTLHKIVTSPSYEDLARASDDEVQERRALIHAVREGEEAPANHPGSADLPHSSNRPA